ncbi:MAG: hypothetical protein ACJA09_003805 [Alcanivorax sp.]|jgi:uncharacterized protein (DUF1800 family)
MNEPIKWITRYAVLILLGAVLVACGGGGGGGSSAPPPAPPPGEEPPTPVPPVEPEPLTPMAAARFLSQASFGPDLTSIDALVDSGLESWLTAQLAMPATLHLQDVLARFPADGIFLDEQGNPLPEVVFAASDSFWEKAITADDQLRQRMAFALSQVLVVSSQSDLVRTPQMIAAYMDVLTEGAFGNFRDLIEDVTYSPAMAVFLTYLRNEKADPTTGRVPDENYARELLQLFTLGLVELQADGSPVPGADGLPIELFDNSDITGLAKVFTGLSFGGTGFQTPLRSLPNEAYYQPLQMFDEFHSSEEKTFLNTTIAANTGGEETIDLALDTIFANANMGPFLARQLIQRFVTSHPGSEYVGRVSQAFDSGDFLLPSGASVGSGNRGDLAATVAAVLFDDDATMDRTADSTFGKLREPVLRFTHWARAFQIDSPVVSNERLLRDTSSSELLGQHPYRSPSVFNFYRPGYIAPGTETGAAQLTAPELQIANASTVIGYINFMTIYALGRSPQVDPAAPSSFVADYSEELVLAADPAALLDHLDLLLTHGALEDETRARITDALLEIDVQSDAELLIRAQLASIMVMTAPEYLVLR